MSWLPFSFGAPMVLAGLLALPVIWWLLRMTPPRPHSELFPPLRILANVLKREETPRRSPWWLTLLRLMLAALIIFALANPVWNPRERMPLGGDALAIVIDNGWASAADWDRRAATAERLIADAGDSGMPIVLALTADRADVDIGPFDAAAALERLNAAQPRPVPVDRQGAYDRAAAALSGHEAPTIALLHDGLATAQDGDAFASLAGSAGQVLWIGPERLDLLGVTQSSNEPNGFAFRAIRPSGSGDAMQMRADAFDDQGRRIADTTVEFLPGASETEAVFEVPFELRNDFTSIVIDGQSQAGATHVLDENSRRRRIGLIAQSESDQAQPLLSPLHYITRALAPYADLIEPSTADLSVAIPELLEQRPAMIVMSDVGTLPDNARQGLREWVAEGGTLVRFGGPRLAAAEPDLELLPVRLRGGERALGGTLSWTEPQAVAEFPDDGPFADLSPPDDVTVSRQVLAEPTSDIVEVSWANLADGTPLVTGDRRGDGTVVLFHITPQATWSNLPISGTFVEMLRRLVQLSRNQGALEGGGNGVGVALAPFRMIAANGQLVPPDGNARPLEFADGALPAVTPDHPPGLYGSEEGVVAHNLLPPDSALAPIERPDFAGAPVSALNYAFDDSVNLRGPFIAAALLLMALDSLAMLWMSGRFARRPGAGRTLTGAATGLGAVVAMSALLALLVSPALADDARPGDDEAIAAITQTRMAYVRTGDSSVDSVSRAGLAGLSRFLTDKTALEPGEPAGIDIETDELAFYPLIYWPISETAPMPSAEAVARIDAYMREGGTVLFDTRDQYASGIDAGSTSPTTQRLRDILSGMNVPALEPVPPDHVLTKTFYILEEFPGRYNGSPLWVEASVEADRAESRPVRTGDGVTPIMITANDLAGAWAIDRGGSYMLPTVPADPRQRELALRTGVNIMMYMLTGNYKSDQVHVPAILERLGQ